MLGFYVGLPEEERPTLKGEVISVFDFARHFEGQSLPQPQLHEQRALDGVFGVRGDLPETHRTVKGDGLLHRRQRIEPHRGVAHLPRNTDDFLRALSPQAASPEIRAHVEALHLADFPAQIPESDASCDAVS